MAGLRSPGPGEHFDFHDLLESTSTPFTVTNHASRDRIFLQGSPNAGLCYIEDGIVKLMASSPSGKEAICGLLSRGAFLGESALCGDTTHRQSAVAITPTTIVTVDTMHLQELLHNNRALLDHFIAFVLARGAHLEAELSDQILNTAEQRLARTLLRLTNYGAADGNRRRLPRLSQEDLANMIGSTRSRVNGFIGKFKKLGFLETDGAALVVNRTLSRAAIGTLDGHRQ